MKVLIADKIAESGVEYLQQQDGFEVVLAYGSTPEQLKKLAADVDAIIVRSASSITHEIIDSAPRLKALGRAGVGVDNIDVSAATDRGILVMNTPGGNTIATAELTFTHLLCSARPVSQADSSMRNGKWEKKAFEGTELFNKTLGVLGLGRIGSEVAKRAKAFGMEVIAYDPFLTESRAEQLEVRKADLDELFSKSDFITVHMPKTEATANMINAAAFAKMKDGVRIVNCARGGLIDEDALADAIESGKVASAGMDVFNCEPLPDDSPLRQFTNMVMTPHLGASTREAQENVGLEVAVCIAEALRGGVIRSAINAPSVDPAQLKQLRPYLLLAYRLGCFIQQLVPSPVNLIRVTYSGKLTKMDVKPLTRAFQRGYLTRITDDVNDINAPRVMERLGIRGEVVQTNLEGDYTELIRIEAHDGPGNVTSVEGTLIGKSQSPRLTSVNEREVESTLGDRYILVIENEDVPGIVGMIGMLLAKDDLNIANMSLSRNSSQGTGTAFTLCGLDSEPSESILKEFRDHPRIRRAALVYLNGN